MSEEEPTLKRIARLCSADIGKEVLPGDVYGIVSFGERYGLQRFSREDYDDLVATIVKELDRTRVTE